MSNSVMLDSSILIEYHKNTKSKLIIELVSDTNIECFVNENVLIEYLYHFLAITGGRSPRATQSAGEIHSVFAATSSYRFIERFSFLQTNKTLLTLVPSFMSQYNLLSNGAIILATCKIHGITQLASCDKILTKPVKAKELLC